MDNWLVHKGETAPWHALVGEAMSASGIQLNEDLESYLVFLLMRFTNKTQIASSIIALDYLISYQLTKAQQQSLLRDVGDKCLIMAGLFPGRAKKRRVRINYFIKIGQSAYQTLSHLNQHLTSELFSTLSLEFVQLIDVLQAARHTQHNGNVLMPADAYDLWQDVTAKKELEGLIQANELYKHGLPKKLH